MRIAETACYAKKFRIPYGPKINKLIITGGFNIRLGIWRHEIRKGIQQFHPSKGYYYNNH